MHNWHLPLFALLAFLQPIVCFSERSFVDGREQCCDRNNLLRDTRLSYGTFRFQKPSQDRHLNSRAEIYKDRRYDIKKDDSDLTRFAANRRLVDFRSEKEASRNSREIAARLIRTEFQRVTLPNDRRERSLPTLESRVRFSPGLRRIASKDIISRDERIHNIVRQRYSRVFDTGLHERDNTDYRRLSRDSSNRMSRNSGDEARHTASQDSRRDNQRIREREIANEFRRVHSRATRTLLQRTRADIARSEISRDRREVKERMSESQIQHDTNRDHRSVEREVSNSRDTRRWSVASRSADRIRNFRQETRSHLREDVRERQHVNSRRGVTERFSDRRQSREERREHRDRSRRESRERITAIHRASRERMSEKRRISRVSVERVRNTDNDIRLERAFSRRNTRANEREVRVYNRAASENRRLESRSIMDQETRQHENNRSDRRSSERMENRDMKREVRNRFTETREGGTTRIEQRMTKINAERGDMDSRFRTNESRRVRESFAFMIREKTQPSEQSTLLNWQYLFYTLQCVYLCSLLIQIMSENGSMKKSR